MTFLKRFRCAVFGDADLVRQKRYEREVVKAQKKEAETRHVEDTQDLLGVSLSELFRSEEVARELEAALQSLEQDDEKD